MERSAPRHARALPLMHHEVSGPAHAPWVTFVPGIGNDVNFWQAQAEALQDRLRVLRFDPWGQGASPPPPADCRFDDMAEGILQLWRHLGIERSSVVGLGFGGSVSLALGLRAPEQVDRIAACCCRPRLPDDRRGFWRQRKAAAAAQGMQAMADATVDRWLNPAFRASHPQTDAALRDAMKRCTLAGYEAYVDAFIEMDFTARLPELQAPVLLVAAEHDHGGGPVEAMREMAGQLPHAQIEVVGGSGHIVNHEAPEAVNALLTRFLVQ